MNNIKGFKQSKHILIDLPDDSYLLIITVQPESSLHLEPATSFLLDFLSIGRYGSTYATAGSTDGASTWYHRPVYNLDL